MNEFTQENPKPPVTCYQHCVTTYHKKNKEIFTETERFRDREIDRGGEEREREREITLS